MCTYLFFCDTIVDSQFTVELVAFGGSRASTSGVAHQFYSGQYWREPSSPWAAVSRRTSRSSTVYGHSKDLLLQQARQSAWHISKTCSTSTSMRVKSDSGQLCSCCLRTADQCLGILSSTALDHGELCSGSFSPSVALILFLSFSSPKNRGTDGTSSKRISLQEVADYPD